MFPFLRLITEGENTVDSDFKMLEGGWFALLATGVDNLTIDNLLVDTNRDGFDIDCCRNVRVSNCTGSPDPFSMRI